MPKRRKDFVKDSYGSDDVLPAVPPHFFLRRSLFACPYWPFVVVMARFAVHSLQFYDERAVPFRTSGHLHLLRFLTVVGFRHTHQQNLRRWSEHRLSSYWPWSCTKVLGPEFHLP